MLPMITSEEKCGNKSSILGWNIEAALTTLKVNLVRYVRWGECIETGGYSRNTNPLFSSSKETTDGGRRKENRKGSENTRALT